MCPQSFDWVCGACGYDVQILLIKSNIKVMGKIENYWNAVRARILEPMELPGVARETTARPRDEGGDEGHDGAHVGFFDTADFYFYRSIRYRDVTPNDDCRWGIYIVQGGLDIVVSKFMQYLDSDQDASDAAVEFLATCGRAHYEFDVYAMSCEAILGRWLYPEFQRASRLPQNLRLEDAFVVQRVQQWAAHTGLVGAVSDVLKLWGAESQASTLPARRLGAYLSTAFLDGYKAIDVALRFDQAEWVATIPGELKGECPGPHLIHRQTRLLHSMATSGAGSILLFGQNFPGGRFPTSWATVQGSFICTHSNLATLDGLRKVVVMGSVDLSFNRYLRSLTKINKHIGKIAGGYLRISEELIKEAVLSLLKVDGLKQVISAS
jgi:hypothetical protein